MPGAADPATRSSRRRDRGARAGAVATRTCAAPATSPGYHVAATDGEIGHVEDFLIDDRTPGRSICWASIPATGCPGRKVLISPAWLRAVDWPNRQVEVGLYPRSDQVRAPSTTRRVTVDEGYLEQLRAHYGLTRP